MRPRYRQGIWSAAPSSVFLPTKGRLQSLLVCGTLRYDTGSFGPRGRSQGGFTMDRVRILVEFVLLCAIM